MQLVCKSNQQKNNTLQLKQEYEIDLTSSSFHLAKTNEQEASSENIGSESNINNDLPNTLLLTSSHLLIGTYNAKIFVYVLPHNKHGINQFKMDNKLNESSEVTTLKESHIVELPIKEPSKQKPVVSSIKYLLQNNT